MTVFNTGPKAARPISALVISATSRRTSGHYIKNVGDEDLGFLEVFRAPEYQDISLSDWLTHTPAADGDLAPEHTRGRHQEVPADRRRRRAGLKGRPFLRGGRSSAYGSAAARAACLPVFAGLEIHACRSPVYGPITARPAAGAPSRRPDGRSPSRASPPPEPPRCCA